MAEGVQVASFKTKYFCHHCSREVSPSCPTELICPDCSTGFLEEVSKDLFEAEHFSQNSDSEYESEQDADEDLSLISGFDMDRLMSQMLLSAPQEPLFNTTTDEQIYNTSTDDLTPDAVESPFLYSDISITGLLQRVGRIHTLLSDDDISRFGHVHDFTDDDEMDALASQLLDEVEISGPPPLSKEQIKALPVVILAKEHIEKTSQCTVCMDDFSLKEKAKSLSCSHLFHEKCIVPWLERQATCPNCRKVIEPPQVNKRSRSCTRASRPSRGISENRRYSEVPSISDFFSTSRNPFRFLN